MSNDFYPNSSSMGFTWHSFPWTLLYLIFNSNGIYLTWYAMNLPQLIFNNLYGRLLSVGFTFDCLQWTYLRHTPSWILFETALRGLGTQFNELCLRLSSIYYIYMRLSLVNFVGDDVQKTAIVPTLCMYLCCVSDLMYFLAHTRLHQWRRCGFHNECDEEIVKCHT